jgi:hypothetical protein
MAMTDAQPMMRYRANDNLGKRKPSVVFASTPSTATVQATPNNTHPHGRPMATSVSGVYVPAMSR